jgi:DNA helicase-2/ATP-dependent DNA helicase PcrA
MELLAKAEEYEKAAEAEGVEPSLSNFLEEVALVADIDGYNEEHDAVVLMTVHSAKGLEFDTVFLAGFEQGIFPSSRAIYDAPETRLEEERRLCYVAITRAREKLYITNAKVRYMYNDRKSNPPSMFLKEIPEELIKSIGETGIPSSIRAANFLKPPAGNIFVTHKSAPDYGTGDFVRQKKYGRGMVIAIKPAGADYEVTVDFPDVGQKKFMAHLSNLEKTV